MNRIEKMIRELCPNGVTSQKLIDICHVQYGYPFDARLFTDNDAFMPIIRIRDVKSAKASTYYSGEILPSYIIIIVR